MKLDRSFFDEIHDRSNTGSVKYDEHPAGYAEVRLLPMWIADMDFRTVPEVCEALAQTASQGIFGYTYTDDVYDQAVVGWYGRRMGWNVDTRWMVKTPGVMFGIAAAIRALTKPGDGVMICQPVYHPFANVISANNRKPVISELRLARGRYEMDFWDIARKIENRKVKLLVLCSPHNPVGRVWTEAELRELGRICIKYGVYLVSDEIHGDFVYAGHRHIPVASLSEELAEITITCTSPSKTFNLAGLQAANLFISDAGIRKKVQKA